MSNVTQNILSALKADLVKISHTNDADYTNTIKKAIAGHVSFGDEPVLPVACYALGPEEIIELDRGASTIATKKILLIVEVLLDASNVAGNITDGIETMIEDVKKHFRQDTAIATAYWSTIYSITGITSVIVNRVFRGIEWKSNQARIVFNIDIEFTELV